MFRKIYILLRMIGIVLVILLIWKIRGPAEILQNTELNGEQLDRGERGRTFIGESINTSNVWASNYSEHLRNAYNSQSEVHVNPHNFKLLLDEPMACMDAEKKTPKRVLLLVLIISVHSNLNRRQAIRETWGSPKELGGLAVVTLFLLANISNGRLQSEVLEESAEYHDLLMEDFQESYNNLTLKTIMAMKWASTHCPQASYVMKTDDDMYVSYRNLLKYIVLSKASNTNIALGMVIAGEAPIRNVNSKWYMPEELYPGEVYPPWLSGGGFVISGDVPGKIYAVSLNIQFLHLEDVFIGLCLEKLNIAPIMNRQFSNTHTAYSYCKFRDIITTHRVPPQDLRIIWKDQLLNKPCWFWT